jgi:hypothetical protein
MKNSATNKIEIALYISAAIATLGPLSLMLDMRFAIAGMLITGACFGAIYTRTQLVKGFDFLTTFLIAVSVIPTLMAFIEFSTPGNLLQFLGLGLVLVFSYKAGALGAKTLTTVSLNNVN